MNEVGFTILLVEDDERLARLTARYLESYPFTGRRRFYPTSFSEGAAA